jgi:aspartate/methionine/tyrosine aminotransferase
MIRSAERLQIISESSTAEISAIANQMKRQNIDIVDLSIGETDFPTPKNVKQAAIMAINNDLSRYTLIPGTFELRQAIAKKLKDENDLDYPVENIIVSNGAKHAIFNIIMALVNPDDEVIIPAPYWVSYPEMVRLAGGKPLLIPTLEESDFKLQPRQLKDSITARTKMLIICNPSNPTGTLYTREDLESLAEILAEKDIYIISDEIYEKLVYDRIPFVSIAAIDPQIKKQTIVINGLSKAYAMTGWRIGYAAGPKDVIRAATILQSHSTTNACSISQYAGIEALSGPQDEIVEMRNEFEKRRNFVYERLRSMEAISCCKPSGAFYTFPNISHYFNRSYNGSTIRNSNDMAVYLLREARVVLMPGIAFGSDQHLRISFATTMEKLKAGMERIETALKKLSA